MIKYFLFLLFFWIKSYSFSQNQLVKIDFQIFYGETEVLLNENILIDSTDWIVFSKLKFYIGNSRSYSNGDTLINQRIDFYLVDFSKSENLPISIETPGSSDSICLLIGTDSLANVSGLFEGALDPLNGMYWAWNSGYVNLKIEGSSSLSASADKKFEYHIGGYLSPNTTANELCFSLRENEAVFKVDLSKIINVNILELSPSITIPGEKAKIFADNFKSTFVQIE